MLGMGEQGGGSLWFESMMRQGMVEGFVMIEEKTKIISNDQNDKENDHKKIIGKSYRDLSRKRTKTELKKK